MMDKFVQRKKIGASNTLERKPLIPSSSNAIRKGQTSPSKPPAKRLKREEIYNSDENADAVPFEHVSPSKRRQARPKQARHSTGGDDDVAESSSDSIHGAPTAIESSLLVIKPDDEALAEYENFKASQGDEKNDVASRLDKREWVRGKSSLYVDAFNLALSTVLEDESHLFDRKEHALFEAWGNLGYEAQFLYVRLFLRKTAAWHRIGRLGYEKEISDTETAAQDLQQVRSLPSGSSTPKHDTESSNSEFAKEEHALGGSFCFADKSEDFISTVNEAISLLSLDELKALAKDAKVQGKNKADFAKSIARMTKQQTGLLSMGLQRSNTHDSSDSPPTGTPTGSPAPASSNTDSDRQKHFFDKIMATTGPCIRLSLPTFKLFERVHLVFYRSTGWTEKSLTTVILAKISRRNFPEYIVSRSANVFASRCHLLEFETATRTEFGVDAILESGQPPGKDGFRRVLDMFEDIYSRWQKLLREEQDKEERVYDTGEGAYLRRFSPVHSYTRIVHKAAQTLGRVKEHLREYSLLEELLNQNLFHPSRRGSWYQRKALLEEHYMHSLRPNPAYQDIEPQKRHWRRVAAKTCETALEDRDCHLKFHYDLQKRLVKLEKQLNIPRRKQHDFGHVRLAKPEEHSVEGIQIKKDDTAGKNGRGPSTKTIWVDEEGEGEGDGECSVETMCLNWYKTQGWKGYHAEGGIIRTLFAYLFYDILFLYIPNVFQTAYQTCPLDLHTDSFYPSRASEINHRLVEIANGGAAGLIAQVDEQQRERRTCVVGLNWDYEAADLVELARCFDGQALAAICRVLAQEYGQRGGGMPDLILWRSEPKPEVLFAEIKSANDRLSDTQRLWIHVLAGAGLRVALCNAVARETRVV